MGKNSDLEWVGPYKSSMCYVFSPLMALPLMGKNPGITSTHNTTIPCTDHCTEVHFARFLCGGFITAIVVNPPERKLCSKQENDKNQHYSTEPIMSLIKTIFISIFSIPYLIELKFCEISCLGHGLITSKYLRCGCRIVLDCLSNIHLSFKVTYPKCSKH